MPRLCLVEFEAYDVHRLVEAPVFRSTVKHNTIQYLINKIIKLKIILAEGRGRMAEGRGRMTIFYDFLRLFMILKIFDDFYRF